MEISIIATYLGLVWRVDRYRGYLGLLGTLVEVSTYWEIIVVIGGREEERGCTGSESGLV